MSRPTRPNWPAGLVAALLCFALWNIAADKTDAPTESEAFEAQLADIDARIQRAASDLCTDAPGPGTQALWTTDGDLVCRPATVTAKAAQ